MADNVIVRAPVTVANLTAAAGVTTTVDGWWPCLDLTWRTPVPPTITKITAQVRERGSDAGKNPPIAETVLTAADLAAGTAKIVNGVSVGQHLEVRLSPAGAPGLPFQPTPWVEVTTSWDALMAALDGVKIGCVHWYCGDGEPTRTDVEYPAFYVREDVAQLWQLTRGAGVPEPAAICFAIDISVYPGDGANVQAAIADVLDQIAAEMVADDIDLCAIAYGYGDSDHTVTSITRRSASSSDITAVKTWVNALTIAGHLSYPSDAMTTAKAFFDATDSAIDQRYLFHISDARYRSVNFTDASSAAEAAAAGAVVATMDGVRAFTLSPGANGAATNTDYLAETDNTPLDGTPEEFTSAGLYAAMWAGLTSNAYDWELKSRLTSIRSEGVEIEADPVSMDFVGAAVSATSNGRGGVTVEIEALAGSTGANDNRLLRSDGTGGATVQASAVELDDNGGIKLPANLQFTGKISPSQITSNQNDYNPTSLATAVVLRVNSDASRDVTGLQGGADGRVLILANVGSFNVVLKDESGSSSAANRFALDGDLTLGTDTTATLIYDSTSSRWRLVAVGKTAGGGGITALTGDVTASGSGSVAATIANGAVTLAKIANAAANSKLLGAGASGSGAAYSEITLGANLAMSGATLNASGGAGVTYEAWAAPPTLASFSWVNQGSVTAANSTYGLTIQAPATGSANLALLVKSAPSTPFDVVMRLEQYGAVLVNFIGAGIALRNSTSGKLVIFYLHWNSGQFFGFERWNSPTSFSAAAGGTGNISVSSQSTARWTRVNVTSTTITVYYSTNGHDWGSVLGTETISTFLTSGGGSLDQVGIVERTDNGAQNTIVNVFSTALL